MLRKNKKVIILNKTQMKNKDHLSYIKTFDYPPLDDLRVDLQKAGYTQKQIWTLLEGLNRLPKYRSQSTFFTTSSVKTVWV